MNVRVPLISWAASWQVRRKIAVAFALAASVLATMVGLSFLNARSLLSAQAWEAHTYEVLNEIELCVRELEACETASRGFALTGDEAFLGPYAATAPDVSRNIGTIAALTRDNPRQRERIPALAGVVRDKLEFTRRLIEARRQEGLAAAASLAATREGDRLMIECRRVLGLLRQEEQRLLRSRTQATSSHARRTAVLLFLGGILQFSLLFAVYVVVSRDVAERRRAAQELGAQLAFTGAITRSIGEGILAIDRDGKTTFANPAAETLLGTTGRELARKNLHDALRCGGGNQPGTPPRSCSVLDVIRTGVPFSSEEDVFPRADGTVFSVSYTCNPILEGGATVGAVLAFRDNTERKRAVEQLAERVRLAAFSAAVGRALTHGKTLPEELTQCAQEMIRHLGGSAASLWTTDEREQVLELKGSAWEHRPLFGPEGRIPVGEFRIGAVARDGRPVLSDLSVQERDDDRDWATREGMTAFAGYPLTVGDRIVGVMALFSRRRLTPVTLDAMASVADEIALAIDRERSVTALQQSESRTRSILDKLLVGLVTASPKGFIESLNPAAERMFGYAQDELVGKHLSMLVALPAGRTAQDFLREAHRQALGRVTEWEARRRNGEVFPMELALFQFQAGDGTHFAGSVRDISERREVDRLKKEFVSTVSHELRTPLTSIRGSLGLLAGGVLGELPAEARDVVGMAERNVVRLVTLINDILDLERFDARRVELQRKELDVRDLLARSAEAVRGFAEQEGIGIEIEETGARVFGDSDRLVQVLVNFVSNAVKFSSKGGVVTLSARQAGNTVEIRVADRGRGIPAAMRTAVFERFRQVEASDARRKGGTGLGLAICKSIVEAHDGTIGVDSEEGKGSTFWFRLAAAPASAEASPRSGPAESVAPVSGWDDVVLVEDDRTLFKVLVRQLARAGLDVRGASTGAEALDLLRQSSPGLLILDLRLPDMDGFELVARLRREPRLASVPLLVYTEQDMSAEDCRRLTLGPSRFLTKSRSTDGDFVGAALELLGRPSLKEATA